MRITQSQLCIRSYRSFIGHATWIARGKAGGNFPPKSTNEPVPSAILVPTMFPQFSWANCLLLSKPWTCDVSRASPKIGVWQIATVTATFHRVLLPRFTMGFYFPDLSVALGYVTIPHFDNLQLNFWFSELGNLSNSFQPCSSEDY